MKFKMPSKTKRKLINKISVKSNLNSKLKINKNKNKLKSLKPNFLSNSMVKSIKLETLFMIQSQSIIMKIITK